MFRALKYLGNFDYTVQFKHFNTWDRKIPSFVKEPCEEGISTQCETEEEQESYVTINHEKLRRHCMDIFAEVKTMGKKEWVIHVNELLRTNQNDKLLELAKECKDKTALFVQGRSDVDNHSRYQKLCKEICNPLMESMLEYYAMDQEEGNGSVQLSSGLIVKIGKEMWIISMVTAKLIELGVLKLQNNATLQVKNSELDDAIKELEKRISAAETRMVPQPEDVPSGSSKKRKLPLVPPFDTASQPGDAPSGSSETVSAP
jgi:predicted kinase